MFWLLLISFSLIALGSYSLLARYESFRKQRSRRRQAQRKSFERSKELHLERKIKGHVNSKPISPEAPIGDRDQAEPGSGFSAPSPFFSKFIVKRSASAEIKNPISIYDEFDSLNYRDLEGLQRTFEGDVGKFPYSSIDVTNTLSFWATNDQLSDGAPTQIYLIRNNALAAAKIGISSVSSSTDRIASHTRNGWHLVKIWTANSHRVARQVELSIIAWWRHELQAPVYVDPLKMPQGGYTETVALQHVTIEECLVRVESHLASTGNEIVYSTEDTPLVPGHVVEGFVTVDAWVRWSRMEKRGRGAARVTVAQKVLALAGENSFSVEFTRRAYNYSVPFTPDVGGKFKLRGRVQLLGQSLRITNPWIFSGTSGRVNRPQGSFDIC